MNPEHQDRPWVSILFECCSVYQRVYINRAREAYEGRCPKCLKPVKIGIGKGGSSDRFFTAS